MKNQGQETWKGGQRIAQGQTTVMRLFVASGAVCGAATSQHGHRGFVTQPARTGGDTQGRAAFVHVPPTTQRNQRHQQKKWGSCSLCKAGGGAASEVTVASSRQMPTANAAAENDGVKGKPNSKTAVDGAASTLSAGTAVIDHLAMELSSHLQKNNWKRVIKMFEDARRAEARLQLKGKLKEPDRVSRQAYNQALLAYAKGKDGLSALNLLRVMRFQSSTKKKTWLSPSRASFNACLQVCLAAWNGFDVPVLSK